MNESEVLETVLVLEKKLANRDFMIMDCISKLEATKNKLQLLLNDESVMETRRELYRRVSSDPSLENIVSDELIDSWFQEYSARTES